MAIKYYVNGFKSLFKLSPSMDTLIACSSLAAIFYGIIIIGDDKNEVKR